MELVGHALLPGREPPPTLAEFVPTFLADCAGRWKQSTLKTVTRACRLHLVPELGDKRLDQITRAEVLVWLDSLRHCQDWALSVLSSLMLHAETLGHREQNSNPCRGLRRKKSGFKAQYPEPDDYRRIGEAINRRPIEDQSIVKAIQFLAMTGARRGEVMAMRWMHVHPDRIVLPDSKTGPKAIWLPPPVRAVLDSIPRGDSAFVFGHEDRARTRRHLDAVWRDVRASVGMKRIRLHDLRHGYASVAVRQGVELKVIARLLGHSDFATTLGYAHLRQEHIALAAQRVSSRLFRAMSAPQAFEGTAASGRP